MAEPRRRNSRAMVAVVLVRVVAAACATTIGALVLQVLVGGTLSSTVILLIVAVAIVRLALIAADWWSTTYIVGPNALEYRVGRVQTSTMRIPYASVHAVQLDAPWLLRLMRRTELRLDFSAGDADSVTFAALRRDEAERIVAPMHAASVEDTTGDDSVVRDASHEDTTVGAAPRSLEAGTSSSAVVLYCLARGRYLLAIPAVFAALGVIAQLTGADLLQALGATAASLAALPWQGQVAFAVAALVVTVLIGFGARLLTTANLRQSRLPAVLESRQGMLSTSVRTIAWSDVTVLELRQPLLYRLTASTMAFVSGGSGKGDPPIDLAPRIASGDEAEVAGIVFPSLTSSPMRRVAPSTAFVMTSTLVTIGMLSLGVTWALLAWSPWVLTVVAVAGAGLVAWLSRIGTWVRLDPGARYLEVGRSWVARRRWVLADASILHVEATRGLLGRSLATNLVRFVVAERGTRTVTIRGLRRADMEWLYADLCARRTLGGYSYVRNAPTAPR